MSRKRRCWFSSFQTPKIYLISIVWEPYPQNKAYDIVAVNTDIVNSDEMNTVDILDTQDI